METPSHTAHWLQPCERGLLKPLIDTYRSIPQLTSKSDQWWNEQDFVAAFTEAWARTVSQERIAAEAASWAVMAPARAESIITETLKALAGALDQVEPPAGISPRLHRHLIWTVSRLLSGAEISGPKRR